MNIRWDLRLAWEWAEAHRALGIKASWSEFLSLRRAYNAKSRHYHGWRHIWETIAYTRRHFGSQPLVVLALFYHDVVYDVQRKDNEEASAQCWLLYVASRTIEPWTARQVADMIRVTAGHKVTLGQISQFAMICDADLHVFLCPDARYLEYARDIWREYQVFGREGYLKGRLEFLDGLDVDKMFSTHQARAHVHHARANVALE